MDSSGDVCRHRPCLPGLPAALPPISRSVMVPGPMSYLVLARKWRPATFGDMTGQEHVVRTLANAIAQDRVAHAFLFCGPRGVGKTTAARILARALNCEKGM